MMKDWTAETFVEAWCKNYAPVAKQAMIEQLEWMLQRQREASAATARRMIASGTPIDGVVIAIAGCQQDNGPKA